MILLRLKYMLVIYLFFKEKKERKKENIIPVYSLVPTSLNRPPPNGEVITIPSGGRLIGFGFLPYFDKLQW